MTSRSKFGLGYGDTFGSDEVFDLSAPSIFDSCLKDAKEKPLYDWFVKPVGMHVVPPPITGTFMPPSNKPDIDDTQFTYGSKSNNYSESNSVSNDFVSCETSDKSSDSETTGFASCASSVNSSSTMTNASSSVDLKTLHKTDDQGPCNVTQNPSFSFKENVKTHRNLCNRNGSNNISQCKNKSFGGKKCFVCGSKFHLIRDCDFYENQLRLNNAPVWKNVENIPSFVPRPAYVPAGSRNRPTSVPAGRPFPAGWHNPAAKIMDQDQKAIFFKVVLGKVTGHICIGDPRTMVDLNNLQVGCSRSMTCNKEKLADFVKIKGGTVTFGEQKSFSLQECLVLSKEFQLPDSSQVVLRVPRRHNLYCFNLTNIHSEREIKCLVAKASLDESTKWNTKDGHGKQTKASYKAIPQSAPISEPSSYFIWTILVLLPSEALITTTIPWWLQMTLTEVKAIRCDNGTEFKNSNLIELSGSKGIKRDYSVARTPQQKRVAERKNRTLIEAARTMLADSKLPTMFWTKVVSTACYVLNRVLVTRPHNKTPYELLSGKVPNISHLKPFGCHVTILNTSDHLGKFKGKVDEGFLVAYSAHSYTRSKSNQPTGTQDTNTHAGTHDDSDSECDEQTMQAADGSTVPTGSGVPATSIPAGSINQAAGGSAIPSTLSSSVVEPVHADDTPLPPGHSLGSSENSTRFSSPCVLANHISSFSKMEGIHHHPTTGIFSESTYDADFGGSVRNLAPTIAVDPVPTRRVHTVYPILHIIGDITSKVLTRVTLKKSKFGQSALAGYVHDQQRNNHTDYLHVVGHKTYCPTKISRFLKEQL
ncbi:putative ribonuclease H-like domain-containing protein [Tanacetum coccineum]